MKLGIANAESLNRFVNNKKPVVPDYRASKCLHHMSSAQYRQYLGFKPTVELTSDVVSKVAKSGEVKSGWTKFMSGLLAKAMKLTKFIK